MVDYDTRASGGVDVTGGTRSRWRRRVVRTTVGYVVVAVVAHGLIVIGVLLSRLLADNPRTATAGIHNFRAVDGETWAGAQPDAEAYQALAAQGVRLVVDLRTGANDDPREDDPTLLRRLGVDYLALPLADGHVPSERQVGRFLAAVRDTDGVVFVHCGGGVGRTSTLTAGYARATGAEVGFVESVALGPHTVEQLWFLATGDTNPLVRRVSELLDAPRRAWSRVRGMV